MKKLISLISLYLPKTPFVLVYMLQQDEYSPVRFLAWVNRSPDFTKVMRRKKLVVTNKAKALLLVAYGTAAVLLALIIYTAFNTSVIYTLLLILIYPAMIISILFASTALVAPLLKLRRQKILQEASDKIAASPALKVAVLGSYGKTTTKEVLATVLAEGKKVAVTPGNMNVDISHARWIINKLDHEAEVIILEYGEGRPGDIERFARLTHPDMAVVTGYAPNHLDSYGSVAALQFDLASIENYVPSNKVFVYEQALELPFKTKPQSFGQEKALGWHVADKKTGFEGTSFTLEKGKDKVSLHSNVLGMHLIPTLAMAAALGLELGLSETAVQNGVAATVPYEHRMQPRQQNGAWIIDDTYNGNLEGIRAGLKLLKHLPAQRKIYVTPGLVEQGDQTEAVHTEIGHLIAEAAPDEVVLMKNSVTEFIEAGLKAKRYAGKLKIESNPLHFYEHMPYTLAAGDVVLMQNDWTDNYN